MSTSANRVGAVVSGALAGLDPAGQGDRARTARRHDVGVAYRGLPDGLAQVVATHRVEDARAIMERLDDDADRLLAHRRDCDPCAASLPDEIGPARAAAHVGLVLGGEAEPPASHDADADEIGDAASDSDDQAQRGYVAAGTDPSAPIHPAPAVVRAGGRGRRAGRRSRRGELQVVLDLATLLGLAEHPGLLAGATGAGGDRPGAGR